jgi:hypothetical protein
MAATPSPNRFFYDVLLLCAHVFNGVMQQPGNGLFFVSTMFQHQSSHAHQMGDIWDGGALASLIRMQSEGERRCLRKSCPT